MIFLRYMAAGKIRTQRNLLISPEFTQLHPGLCDICRRSLEGGWKLFDSLLQLLHVGHSVIMTIIPKDILKTLRVICVISHLLFKQALQNINQGQ